MSSSDDGNGNNNSLDEQLEAYRVRRDHANRAHRLANAVMGGRVVPDENLVEYMQPSDSDMERAIMAVSRFIADSCNRFLRIGNQPAVVNETRVTWVRNSQQVQQHRQRQLSWGADELEELYMEALNAAATVSYWERTGVAS
jgi:hypothetical protein